MIQWWTATAVMLQEMQTRVQIKRSKLEWNVDSHPSTTCVWTSGPFPELILFNKKKKFSSHSVKQVEIDKKEIFNQSV